MYVYLNICMYVFMCISVCRFVLPSPVHDFTRAESALGGHLFAWHRSYQLWLILLWGGLHSSCQRQDSSLVSYGPLFLFLFPPPLSFSLFAPLFSSSLFFLSFLPLPPFFLQLCLFPYFFCVCVVFVCMCMLIWPRGDNNKIHFCRPTITSSI